MMLLLPAAAQAQLTLPPALADSIDRSRQNLDDLVARDRQNLADALARSQANVEALAANAQRNLGQDAAAIRTSVDRTEAATADLVARDRQNLADALARSSANLKAVIAAGQRNLAKDREALLENAARLRAGLADTWSGATGALVPTPGTEAFSGSLEYQGVTRHWIGIRPIGAPAGAPVLLLLHADTLSPERMANLTRAGRLAADYGAWIYVPDSVGPRWADDPTISAGADDVGFLAALVRSELATHQLDATRVYAAGYSNGGFLAEWLACAHPDLLAGIAIVAATQRDSTTRACSGAQRTPFLLFAGTADAVTPYNGEAGLLGAAETAAWWAVKNGCSDTATPVEQLDADASDGTRIEVAEFLGCARSRVRLYSVDGGGHTWPGSSYARYTVAFGATSFDVDATTELWQELIGFAR